MYLKTRQDWIGFRRLKTLLIHSQTRQGAERTIHGKREQGEDFWQTIELNSKTQIFLPWTTSTLSTSSTSSTASIQKYIWPMQVDLSLMYSQKQVSTPKSSRARRCQSEDRSVVSFAWFHFEILCLDYLKIFFLMIFHHICVPARRQYLKMIDKINISSVGLFDILA